MLPKFCGDVNYPETTGVVQVPEHQPADHLSGRGHDSVVSVAQLAKHGWMCRCGPHVWQHLHGGV